MMEHVPVIDSHIHLYPESELDSLAWCGSGNPLRGQYSIEEYLEATGSPANLHGFVFIETDRKSHLNSDEGWEEPLAEVDWLKRIAHGHPRPGEGHAPEHAKLCLAIVPWAPVPLGAEAMCRYVERVKARAGSVSERITGFRYLVQDKPRSTMLQPGFIEGLRWLGEQGYVFDLGVDHRSGGLWQLDEAVEMVLRAHEGVPEDKKVAIVINHMCKPDMRSPANDGQKVTSEHPAFQEWSNRMLELAAFSKTYMKISGAFSEINPLPTQDDQESMGFWSRMEMLRKAEHYSENWIAHLTETFGSRRVMFGSDWPVCNIGGGGNRVAYRNWWCIVRDFSHARLHQKDWEAIWGGTAAEVYRIPFH